MTAMPRCRSCNAEIIWATTTTGKLIPLDLGLYDNGNIDLIDGIAHVVTGGDRPRRRTHFASCPDSDTHRRRHPAAHHPVPRGLEDK